MKVIQILFFQYRIVYLFCSQSLYPGCVYGVVVFCTSSTVGSILVCDNSHR